MHLHNGYGTADVTSHRQHHQQLFSPASGTFHLPTNFSMPASSPTLQDLGSQPTFMQHHQFPSFGDNQPQQLPLQQQQQLSEMIVEHLESSNFRAGNGIGHQNGSVLPLNLIGLTGGDHNDIAVSSFPSPPSAQFWRSNSNGMLEQQFHKSHRIDTAEPNYQHQEPEFEYPQGSAGEIYETRQFPNPNTNIVTALKCSKCSRDSNAEDDYDKKLERQLKLMAQSIENQILAHQERLYERFTAKIEELERKRNEREESRRAAEAEKAQAQAAARAQEQAAAASREAVLVSYLEKITGGKIQLPASGAVQASVSGGRWPMEEVDALVEVRSEMEPRFLEPGSKKNLLWEEISTEMVKLGYQKDAKRCKEKWENIRKYYERKRKEGEFGGGEEEEEEEGGGGSSVKKRGIKRKYNKRGYLDKLNQLYSNNLKANGSNVDSPNTGSYSNNNDCEGDGEENQLVMEANPSQSKSE